MAREGTGDPARPAAGGAGATPVDGSGDAGIPHLPGPVVAGGIAVGVLAVSTAAILIRLADAHPLALSFWRCALGALALAPFALRSRRGAVALDSGQRRQLVGAGVLLAVHFALFISALDYTTVASASVLVAMSPLFVGLGAAVFLREPPGRRTWLGIVIAACGAVVVGVADAAGGGASQPLLGDVLAFGGAAAAAGYLLIGRAARRRLPVTVYAAAIYGVAAAVLLPVCLLGGVELWGYDGGTWLAILGLVAGPQLLGHTVFNTLLSTVTATVVAVAVLAEPVGATILAAILLGELPATGFWAGAPLILVGVFLAAARPRKG
jgi:drug/metabolite transporter (DMT)-like permease